MSFAAALMLGSFFLWAAMGMPIGFSMLASAFLYLLVSHQDIGLVAPVPQFRAARRAALHRRCRTRAPSARLLSSPA
jgi:hypothetical protein